MKMPADSDGQLRVLHWITHLGLGGAESVALSLIRGLRGRCVSAVYAVEGVELSAIGYTMRDELQAANVNLFSGRGIPAKYGGMVLDGLRGARVVREFKPDVIHLHTEIPEAAYSAMIALRAETRAVPLVRTIHNSRYWHHWPRVGCWCERRMRDPRVAAVSEDARNAFERFRASSKAGPLSTPTRVIYNGVATSPAEPIPFDLDFQTNRLPPRTREVTSGGVTRRIVFAGRFEEQKGADLLPAIVRGVRLPAGTSCEFVLHGSGTYEPLLRQLATQAPRGWTIHVLPPVANLAGQFAAFDLTIMPSRFEGLGLVAIESALAGVPVVATDADGLREALPSQHPWRARAGDAASFVAGLESALAETHRWPQVVAEARAFARTRFDFDTMCDAYFDLYCRAAKASESD
jgi:glycosyltransferase involved in cell wall biosynthesis